MSAGGQPNHLQSAVQSSLQASGLPLAADHRRPQRSQLRAHASSCEQQNSQSVQRSTEAAQDTSPAGETQVPDSVRDVISSPGQSLDTDVQRAMEDRLGDSFSDVQIHTGPRAAQACDEINAKAFTVGNNIAFNHTEYDPTSIEGQHTLAHELVHVRQQTGGAVSMLPQDDLDLEIDPDPELEREAEETAQRVIKGEELGIQRLQDTDVHVQRLNIDKAEEIIRQYRQAVVRNSDLEVEDLREIEQEIGLDVSDTEYTGEQMHDALNLELLDEAESVLKEAEDETRSMIEATETPPTEADEAEQAEQIDFDEMENIEKVEGEEEHEDWLENVQTLQNQNIDMADKFGSQEQLYPEVHEKIKETEEELERLIGGDSIRLTEDQSDYLKQALVAGGGSAGTTVLLNYLVDGKLAETSMTILDLWQTLLHNYPTAMAAAAATFALVFEGVKEVKAKTEGIPEIEDTFDRDGGDGSDPMSGGE